MLPLAIFRGHDALVCGVSYWGPSVVRAVQAAPFGLRRRDWTG
jgi:hypothetical protein